MANEISGNPWNEFSKTRKCLNTVGADRPGFHGDLYLIKIIENILNNCNFFIETGTYHGCTSYYVSKNFKNIKCFSCELDNNNFNISINNTVDCKNLKTSNIDSISFLKNILKENIDIVNNKTLFWLDAHGHERNSGPVLEEIKIIKDNFKEYAIFVDDVNIPNIDNYDQYDLEYFSKINDKNVKYFIPDYNIKTGYSLTGWLLITNMNIENITNAKKLT
jgi:hypothetical protein